MRKLTLLIVSLLCYVGVLHAQALVADGVYTLSADENKQRGELVAAADYNYPVLDGIDLSNYTGNSTAAMANGQYWYVQSVDASSNTYYIYNIAKGKYLVNENGNVNFGDNPYVWTFVTNANKPAYLNIKDANKTDNNKVWLSSGCGRTASQRPVQWDGNNNDGGALYTFTRIFATPETGKFYKIKGDGELPWLTATTNTSGNVKVSANADDAGVFLKTENGIQAVATGKYLGYTGGKYTYSDTQLTIELRNTGSYLANDNNKYAVVSGNNYMFNNNTDGIVHESSQALDLPRLWAFIEVEAPAATVNGRLYETLQAAVDAAEAAVAETNQVQTLTLWKNSDETIELPIGVILEKNGFTADHVTDKQLTYVYNFVYGETVKATQNGPVTLGAAFPAINAENKPFGVELTDVPEGNVVLSDFNDEGKVIKDITVTISNLPFVAAADNASIENWYYIQMHSYDASPTYNKHIQSASATEVKWADNSVATEKQDACTWGFVGNPYDGFKVVNYATGTAIAANGDAPVLNEAGVQWIVTASTYNEDAQHFCLKYPDEIKYLNANAVSGALGFYHGPDAGSTMWVTSRDINSEVTELTTLVGQANDLVNGWSGKVGDLTEDSKDAVDAAITTAQAAISSKKNLAVAKQGLEAAMENVQRIEGPSFDGEGTAASPYIINNEEMLVALRDAVNGGEAYEGKYFKLTSDITLSDEWTAIGNGSRSSKSYTGNAFKGVFDGGNNTISGLTITSTTAADAAIGLFGVVDGGTVKNVNLTNVNINVPNSNLAGAAIGMMLNGATAEGITVSGAVVGNDGVGGIVGRLIINGTIANCTNNASVTSNYGGIGGIVGKAYYDDASDTSIFATIANCTNNGTITAPMYVGGIVGLARANVTGCVNNGEIKGGTQTGGIIGQLIAAGTVSANENKAAVSGTNHVGGIIGDYSQSNAYTYYNVSITNNINRGELSAQQCAAIMGCNNIDGFTAMTATGNQSFYFTEGLELFGNPEDMVIDATNKFVVPVAKIGEQVYYTFEDALADAQPGDEVVVVADVADVVVDIDKNLTISGSATLNNVGLNANGADALTVKGLDFTGNSWINSGTAEALTISGITANVAPVNTSYTNSRSAFISLGKVEAQQLALTVEDSKITVTSQGPDAILGWAAITEATIKNNVLKGSSDGYFNNADAVKFMAIADGAEFDIRGNEIYSNYNGIVFAQNTTRDNAYSVEAAGNKFVGGADHIWIEVSGGDVTHATFNAASDNTVNGNAITANDIKYHSGVIKSWSSYAGIDVVTDADGKVIGGTLASFSNEESLADGFVFNDNGDGTYGVQFASYIVLPDGVNSSNYAAKFGDNTVTDGTNYYATLQAAVEAVAGQANAVLYCKPGADVGSLQHAPVTSTLTVYGNGADVTGDTERDFDLSNTDPSGGNDITADMTLTVKHLNGCGAWGNKATEHTVNLVFENCANMGKVFITGTTGTLNITMTDCAFEGVIKEAVYSNADGAITLTNVAFSNLNKAVNLNHKAAGTQTVTIDGCTFTNCGADVTADQIPVRVLSSVEGGKSVLAVTGSTFTGTPEGGADILLDYGVGQTTASVSGTAANVVVEKENNVGTTTAVKAEETVEFTTALPVAQVGETKYMTLAEAVAAATEGATITMLSDVELTESLVIAAGKTITLNLNGKTVDVAWEDEEAGKHIYALTNNGTLTVTGDGTINTRGIYNYGAMTLTSGTINAIDGNGGYGVCNYDGATFIMNGGTIATTLEDDNKVDKGGYDATPVYVEEGATFTMNGGVINNICDFTVAINNYGTTTINNGEATTVHTTLANSGTMTINGGEFTCNGIEGITAHALWAAAGETTINGGTFNGKDNYNGFNVDAAEGAVVNITGGTFLPVHSGSLYGKGTITVSGGTFFDAVPADRCAEGYTVVDNGDGTYGVEEAPAYVAKIGEQGYETLAAALSAANDGETVTLVWADGDAPIAMNGSVFGKNVTITGTATVDWSKGFLFVGRGGEGNATVTFDGASLTSASDQASTGIHVSGREKDTSNKYDGTLVIKNSTIELDYLINKNTMSLDNSTLTVKNGFSIGGRPASETESGADATATISLANNSKVIVNDHNGMGLGYEAIGVMNIDATSTFEATQAFLVTAKGTMNVAAGGAVSVNGTLTVNGTLVSKGNIAATIAAGTGATIEISGGVYTQDVNEWCVENYAALPDLNGNYVVGVKPTATVHNLGMTTVAAGDYSIWNGSFDQNTEDDGDMPLSFVMQFLADQDAEDMETSPFADWYGDFVITFTGIENGSFTADGCYLAGHYGSFGWVKVPVDGMTIEEGARYPVMLGVGMGQKYNYICSSVEDFKCALYLTPEILETNPNIEVKLELAVVDNSKGSDVAASALINKENIYSVTEYTYDADDFEKVELPEVVITDIKGSLTDSDPDLTFALNFAIKDVENLDPEYLDKLFAQYGDWYTDYVLTISGLTDENVTFNANGGGDGYLAGQYDEWSENWVSVPFEDVTLANGASIYIMEYAAKLMGQSGLRFTLAEVAQIVQNFDCGVYFTPEFLAANPNMKVDLQLKVFTEDAEGNKVNNIDVATNNFEVKDYVAIVHADGKQTKYCTTFADAVAAAADGATITMLSDVELTEAVKVVGKAITLDLNGKTVSGTCNSNQGHLIYIENGAGLTVKDGAVDGGGKLTYAQGTSNVGWTVAVMGNLTLESGTIELTGEWSIGYAVDVRPNAWGVAYTEPSMFTMNGGNVVSSDGAVRVASSSADQYANVSASFVMNGGEIDAAWDGVFIQQSNTAYDVLNFTINDGTIKSGLNPVRVYGPAPTSYVNGQECMSINFNGGTMTYTGTETREWVIDGVLRVGGGSSIETIVENGNITASEAFAQVQALPEGYIWEQDGETYKVVEAPKAPEVVDGKIEFIDGEFDMYTNDTDIEGVEITYKRTISNKWNAIYLPFEIPASELLDNFDIAYINDVRETDADDDGELDSWQMELIKIKKTTATLKANHPYFIRSKSAEYDENNLSLTLTTTLYKATAAEVKCSSMYSIYTIKGLNSLRHSSEFADNERVVGIKADGTTSWGKIAEGYSLKPFRFYLSITNHDGSPVVSGSAQMSIVVRDEDGTTGIDGIYGDENGETVIFDLYGRRVLEPEKGNIYIINGKKVLVK